MLKVGDNVLHQKNGHSGKVIGYGHQMLNGVFLPTLKVRVVQGTEQSQRGFIEEDLFEVWQPIERN